MPVLLNSLPDPTTPTLEGDELDIVVPDPPLMQTRWLLAVIAMNTPIVPAAPNFGTMLGALPIAPREVVRDACTGGLMTANAGIVTPCGAWVPTRCASLVLFDRYSTTRWTISGTTRDSTGTALGNCRVVALETGRVAVGESPVVGQTESDAGGVYSMTVPMNTAYWLLGYKIGSPDVGGTTIVNVVPE